MCNCPKTWKERIDLNKSEREQLSKDIHVKNFVYRG